MDTKRFGVVCLISLMASINPALAAAAEQKPSRPVRPTPPARDPNTPGYVAAKELPDGAIPPADADGNFIIGPTHNRAPEMTVREGVPRGAVHNLTMRSADSKIYPGIAREPKTYGTADPTDPAKLVVTTSHPAPYTRRVAVYVPRQYVPGTAAPFIVGADGPDRALFTALDQLIAQHRVPVMIAVSIGNGSGDAQGSQRGLEYDTMSGLYAEFVEKEVLPLVEKQCNVKLTKDPDGRATTGCSSGGSCAMIMAWYHPELYHRVLTYSGTYVNQQWPSDPETPHGAWEFHEHLIANSPVKPLRIWMEVGDKDLFNPSVMRDNMHDWVVANENMAKVLAAKGYHYQFVFARNARHCDGGVKQQTLPEALEYVWRGYPLAGVTSGAAGRHVRFGQITLKFRSIRFSVSAPTNGDPMAVKHHPLGLHAIRFLFGVLWLSAGIVTGTAPQAVAGKVVVKVVAGGESATSYAACRRMLVGPGVNQPDPHPGYTGFVGWQYPIRLHDGTLLVGFSTGYWHASPPTPLLVDAQTQQSWIKIGFPADVKAPTGGRAMLIRSSDGGRTWSKPQTIIDTPWDDRSPAFLELPNGAILCSFFMYSGASIKEHPELAHRTCVIRSFDKGKTWEQKPRRLPSPFLADATDGPPILLKDGSVLLAVYGTPREGIMERQAIFRTTDGGETWQLRAVVKADHELSESGLAQLQDGRLVMICRPEGDLTWSDDGGRTWTPPVAFGMRMFEPSLLSLSDGTLLCLHGSYGAGGQRAIFSTDGGQTWIAPAQHHGFAVDPSVYGYGRGTLLPDGSVFTAYIHTGGHAAKDAQTEAIWGIRLRVRGDHSGIDLLPAPGR